MDRRLATSLAACLGLTFACLAQAAGGYYTASREDGRWWLLDGEGRRFISKGVTTVSYAQDTVGDTDRSPYAETNRRKYDSVATWRAETTRRLFSWGFNTLGAWSDPEVADVRVDGRNLAHAPILNLGARFITERQQKGADHTAWLNGVFPDVFDPAFEPFVRGRARELCAPRAGDRSVLGWFTDNEFRWAPDWRSDDEVLVSFLNAPPAMPGRAAAFDLLERRHAGIESFNTAWRTTFASWDQARRAGRIVTPHPRKHIYLQNAETERTLNAADPARAAFVADCEAFLALAAEEYFRVTVSAVQAAAPHQMVFGCRFAYVPATPVIEAAARHLDVVSANCYGDDPTRPLAAYAAFGRPVIIGEFSFRGADSGLPNSRGAGPVVSTQAERAAAFERYVRAALADPAVVGYHWFEHADQPAEGRFDGENSNYGVVSIADEPYELLTRTMTRVNARAEAWHALAEPRR